MCRDTKAVSVLSLLLNQLLFSVKMLIYFILSDIYDTD
jgi:hypothetical protein